MDNFSRKLGQAGYDAEEAYFHKLDRELLEKARAGGKPQLRLLQGGKANRLLDHAPPPTTALKKTG